MRHARRMHSGDDDYEYEEELAKRRERRMLKGARSRENFESGGADPSWYHSSNHHSWSPPEEDGSAEQRASSRQFERSSYERSTYGPPYEKRDVQPTSLPPYNRKDYKHYDKPKYYRDYPRSAGYEYDGGYADDEKGRKISYYDEYDQRRGEKGRSRDYDDMFEPTGFSRDSSLSGRSHKTSKDYFYEREKRSFDRESNESFESAGRRRKSYGSGDMYGSLDSREEFRDRYSSGGVGVEKNRSIRKGPRTQRSNEEYEQDTDGEMVISRRCGSSGVGDTRSLQRPVQGTRPRKSSGSSPWDGEGMHRNIKSF